ncbi:MAG: hypothetical protein GC168_14680 [Candidatus Hydrogenedens sp.]|nr:hypothetical protein [Candidatus Hydrogenedens sp.]
MMRRFTLLWLAVFGLITGATSPAEAGDMIPGALPGVNVYPQTIVTTENGNNVSIEITLTSPPAQGQTVEITLQSTDVTECTLANSTLTFDATNWNVPQFITAMPGPSGDGNDGDVGFSLEFSPVVSGDSTYTGMTIPAIKMTNQNIDGISVIVVDPGVALETSESGGTDILEIYAGSDVTPLGDVSVVVTASPASEVLLSINGGNPSSQVTVQLTAGNGYSNLVTLHGQDDFLQDGDAPFTITTSTAVTGDPSYHGLNPADTSGRNIDNDVLCIVLPLPEPGLTVFPASILTTEDGVAVPIGVVLDAPPAPGETVMVSLISSDNTEGTLSPGTLTFDVSNWEVPQTVTLTPGASGDGNDGDVGYSIDFGPAVSGDPDYNGIGTLSIPVTNRNAEGISTILIDPADGLETTEDGVTATFDIYAVSAFLPPVFPITVPISVSNSSEVLLSINNGIQSANKNVVLDAGNGFRQTVTVHGQEDAVLDGDAPFTITTSPVVTIEVAYNGINPPDVSGRNLDNELDCAIGFFHTADQDRSSTIDLNEVLRVVQFYNAGGFGCQQGTEDGFTVNGTNRASCCPHHSDFASGGEDWTIELTELLRLIQFYNSGAYFRCPGECTEDGFCAGTN